MKIFKKIIIQNTPITVFVTRTRFGLAYMAKIDGLPILDRVYSETPEEAIELVKFEIKTKEEIC